ncbi:Pbi2p NDAI_0G00800 [Naumovozyma dairenensis CBS 421]|uniref:Inhibitor I9 domain-containing protein n=1 Tax=Naumovozyma dairenensis (strain ATCC 10597 / BCRC 20456 / CBS 421 / NBRC 0211 / NRRL Y-12639) TaxID=1071378 RepID=G0WDJ5_NAUDC|nr:hypothetical protein NDAI_0G00800 [Naumovozyma dairenensis CBS 421]CCD25856.2 hypothetical protein NDAI_0G00800 [Naumovozyma dairenensis CBS 421]
MAKDFIVTLKKNTPKEDAHKVVESINHLGGTVVHEFSLIKGFKVKVPDGLHLDALKKKHGDTIVNIEEDKEVHAN